jgi:hypothetical protein
LATINDDDRALARQAVRRIEEVGANHGKSLGDDLERRVRDAG